MLTQISILYQFHDHMQMFRRLESIIKPQHEWMAQLSHYFGFGDCVLDLVVGNQELLLHRFHRIHSLRCLVLHLEYLAEGPFAQKFNNLEILKLDRLSGTLLLST